MSVFDNIALGFSVAITPENFLYCLAGAFLGTLVGVFPGLGPVTTIAMLLPFTFKLPAVASLIMLSGIYYGAHHSGSTTAVMLNMPGEPTSVVICIDGHPMARQGRAGPALATAAISSFFAGCVAVVIIAFFSPPLASIGLAFGSADYASLIVMALVTASALSSESFVTTTAMAALGVLLGTVGTDVNSGAIRFDFGQPALADGVNFVAAAVGLFAFADVITHVGALDQRVPMTARITGLMPTKADLKASSPAILRGTAIGSAFGILPGTGPLISSFASYVMERGLAKDKSRFGNGAIEGVAGPEAANNAAALTHFIPMLTLGIPAGAANALLMGALIIQGIAPGPLLIEQHADLFWGVVASMWIGNLMLLVLNLPLVGIWVRLLAIPYRVLYPAVLVFCCIGVYSVSNATFDLYLAAGFAFLGVIFKILNCSPAPLILGLVLGPMLEENTRRAMLLSRGDFTIFLTLPISLAMLILAVVLVVVFSRSAIRDRQARLANP